MTIIIIINFLETSHFLMDQIMGAMFSLPLYIFPSGGAIFFIRDEKMLTTTMNTFWSVLFLLIYSWAFNDLQQKS
jgi:hypothetical protein